MKLIKPKKLKSGDKVAIVTLSWGGPSIFPHRYEVGVKQLVEEFGVEVVEFKTVHMNNDDLYNHPEWRAKDLMNAFLDPDVKAIICTIGGEDTIRLLPYIDFDVIKNNPKIFLGFSDPTANHYMCYKAGLSSFYGPSIMAGFAENAGMHNYTKENIYKTLFSSEVIGEISASKEGWTNEMLSWSNPENQNIKRKMQPSKWNYLQGEGIVEGHLIGGNMEIMEMMKNTELFPPLEDFDDAILFFETCTPEIYYEIFSWWLRNYGVSGILNRVNGIIFGRQEGGVTKEEEFKNFDSIIQKVLKEFGLEDLPVITQMDFGHTYPIFTIPIGAKARMDMDNKKFEILESGVV